MTVTRNEKPVGSTWFVAAVGILALWDAFRLRWLSDDAFISFRYAKHFAEGKGLVYNSGEYVEGYTNLLWTVVLALTYKVGITPEVAAHFLSLLCYAGCLYCLTLFTPRKQIPVAMLLAAGMYHMRIFATSGLETMSFIFLVSVALLGVWQSDVRKVSVACILAILTRPEGALLWGAAAVAMHGSKDSRKIWGCGIATLLGITAWRYGYYGEFLPNTYFAKVGTTKWAQGGLYIGLFFGMYWFLLFALPGLQKMWKGSQQEHRLARFSLIFLTVYVIHVLRVGGDFMMARFCLPWVPVLAVSIGLLVAKMQRQNLVGIGIGVLTLTAIYPERLTQQNDGVFGINGITEERHWYPEEWREKAEKQGESIQKYFVGSDAQVVIYGAQAMFAYYAQLPYVLEGMTGLTDKELARLPERSSRTGHGRKADMDYLQQRGIDLYIDFRINQSSSPFNALQFDSIEGAIISYDAKVLGPMREKGAKFVDFPAFLDEYLGSISTKNKAQIESDYHIFNRYYFQHNEDKRETVFSQYVTKTQE